MTTTEAPSAGAELDAEVARKIFGFWIDEEGKFGPYWFGSYPALQSEQIYVEVCLPGQLLGSAMRHPDGLPKFSTHIVAAILVVEHLRERRYAMEVQDLRRFGVDEWEVSFVGPGPGPDGYAKANTLPLAICRAAIATISSDPARGDAGLERDEAGAVAG